MNELVINNDIFISNNKTIKNRLVKELSSLYLERKRISDIIDRKSNGYWIRQTNEPNYNRMLGEVSSKIEILERILFDYEIERD